MSTDETPRPDVQRGGPGKSQFTVTSGPLVEDSDNEQHPAVPGGLRAALARTESRFEPVLVTHPLALDLPEADSGLGRR